MSEQIRRVGASQMAYGKVQTVEKTFCGRTMFEIVLQPNGCMITGSYPAVGVDPVGFEIGHVDAPIQSVTDFRLWLANNYELVEPIVRAARSRRYINRSEAFGTGSGIPENS